MVNKFLFYVGNDWATQSHQVCLIDQNSKDGSSVGDARLLPSHPPSSNSARYNSFQGDVRTGPAGFRAVVQRFLAKEAGRRYQGSAGGTGGARSDSIRRDVPHSGASARPYKLGRWALAAVLAVVVLVGGLLWEHFGRARVPARIRSVAVLPLANFSHDPEQEFFADGMTEQLITDLSKIRALRVISRTSVMQYKGTQKRLPAIARELNVDAVVEGSVMRVGDQVRITAQLVQAAISPV